MDYDFAQREICMNDRSSGMSILLACKRLIFTKIVHRGLLCVFVAIDLSDDALAVLEEKHQKDKEGMQTIFVYTVYVPIDVTIPPPPPKNIQYCILNVMCWPLGLPPSLPLPSPPPPIISECS